MLDYILCIMWSLAYIVTIFLTAKYKKSFFPLFAIILNISWELAAISLELNFNI